MGGERASGDDRAAVQRAVERLTRLRQTFGTRLLSTAQLAYEAALSSAGVKVISRARNRSSPTKQRQARSAVDQRGPLAPVLAALGITEADILAHAFDTFREYVVNEVERYRSRQATLLGGIGLSLPDLPPVEEVADFLVAGLTAMARSRLLLGDKEAITAAAPRLVPRKRAPRPPVDDFYDLPAGLPDPDELSMAAARLVRNALQAADGRVHMRFPSSPDQLPTVVTAEPSVQSIEERIALEFNVAPVWRWAHGFYGEPLRPFDPHVDLDGFETTNREGDPDLYNDAGWPESDLFQPGDHEGCTCEWVVAVD